MKASHLLAPLFLSILQEQSAQTQYPRDVPADLQVTTKDNKIVMLNDVLAKGKTLLVFTTDGCPMMPQGGTKSPLADYANMDAAIKADKLEGTKIVFVIDYNAADYVKRNPVIKDVDFYNASAQVWDAFGAQRANNSFLIEDG
ncbi:MAG TPA: hypothetical protein PKW15_02140, partial [Alphaproteobacteria bacterium]|nr:hypothetical protein [Alphaproteobacteria bacterium]